MNILFLILKFIKNNNTSINYIFKLILGVSIINYVKENIDYGVFFMKRGFDYYHDKYKNDDFYDRRRPIQKWIKNVPPSDEDPNTIEPEEPKDEEEKKECREDEDTKAEKPTDKDKKSESTDENSGDNNGNSGDKKKPGDNSDNIMDNSKDTLDNNINKSGENDFNNISTGENNEFIWNSDISNLDNELDSLNAWGCIEITPDLSWWMLLDLKIETIYKSLDFFSYTINLDLNSYPLFSSIMFDAFKFSDAPLAWGLYFQDGASPSLEGIVDLHNRIMFYLVVILFGVTWVLLSIMWNFNKSNNKLVYRYLNHGTLIELIWTVGPALVLVAIAFPSFKLLYLMDEVIDPAMTVKVTGHQWYWEYEYADFLNEENESINFDSYMKDEASLEMGELRLLEVDNSVVLPIDTHIRFIITGADVLHSWAVPALGIKVDACPGRLNQASVIIERSGHFYGQCSEICGVLHSSMPIKIEAVEVEKFFSWLLEQ